MNMRELQALGNPSGPSLGAAAYGNWEATRAYTCACDPGFAGADCSLALCPHGDLPDSINQQRRAIRVLVSLSGGLAAASARFRLHFAGYRTDPVTVAALTTDNCAAAFASGGSFDPRATVCRVARGPSDVSGIDGGPIPGDAVEVILSLAFPGGGTPPNMNGLFSHDGNPPASAFGCYADESMSAASRALLSCAVTDVDTQTLTVAGDPTRPGVPPDPIPLTTRYQVAITGERGYPNQAVVTKVVAGLGPQGSDLITTYDPAPLSTAGTRVGSENLYLSWSALFGHTQDAVWTIRVEALGSGGTRTIVDPPGTREYVVCSGSGACDLATGLCECGEAHTGSACDIWSNTALLDPSLPILSLVSLPADYSGDILQIRSVRPLGAPAFNYLTVADGTNDPFFRLRGDGLLEGLDFAFSRGGLVDGGLTAQISGHLASSYADTPVTSVYYGSSSVVPAAPTLVVASEFPLNDPAVGTAAPLLRVEARETAGFPRKQPILTVAAGGRVTTQFGVTVETGGASIAAGGVQVLAGGVQVGAGGASVVGSSSFVGPLGVRGDVTIAGAVSIEPGFGGLTSDTITATGAASVGGQLTNAGGISVSAGGIHVTTGGLEVEQGGGVFGSGGLSVHTGGAVVNAGGLSALMGGVYAADGNSVGANGEPGAVVALAQVTHTVASFVSNVAAYYGGTVVHVEGPDPASTGRDYALLRLIARGGAASLSVNKNADIVSGDDLTISTEPSTQVSTGSVSFTTGWATGPGANAGNVVMVPGGTKFGNGGDVRMEGGASSINAGHAVVTGGEGIVKGGNVVLQPGRGIGGAGIPGSIFMNDAMGVPRLTITGDGDIFMSPPSGAVTSIASDTAPIITAATILSLTGSVAVVARGGDDTMGLSAGDVSIFGGNSTTSGRGGDVVIGAGGSATGNSGRVQIHSADGGVSNLRVEVNRHALQLFSDNGDTAGVVSFGTTGDAGVTSLGGALVMGGTGSFLSGLYSGGSITGQTFISMGGVASFGGDARVGGGLYVAATADIEQTMNVGDQVTIAQGGIRVLSGDVLIGSGGILSSGGSAVLGGAQVDVTSSLNVAGAASFGTSVYQAAGGATINGGLLVDSGDTVLNGLLSVMGSPFTGSNYVEGAISVQGAASVGGGLEVVGLLTALGDLSLGPSSTVRAHGGTILLGVGGSSGSEGGVVSTGGALYNHGSTSLNGGVVFGSGLNVKGRVTLEGGITVEQGDLAITAGAISSEEELAVHRLAGALSVGGAASFASRMEVDLGLAVPHGPISASPNEGIVGSPLLLLGWDAGGIELIPGGDVSVKGGNALDGMGGNVVVQPGRKGGNLPNVPGTVSIISDAGDARLVAGEQGVAITGGELPGIGVVSLGPRVVAAGSLSFNGVSSFVGQLGVQGLVGVKGGASILGGMSVMGEAAQLVQQGSGGTLSYEGTLAGSGALSPSMITPCNAVAWSSGGLCRDLYSAAPTDPGVTVRLYWNWDTVTRSIDYGGVSQPIAPGAIFPVYVAQPDPGWRR